MDPDALELEFVGEVWPWRGPAPFHFVTVSDEASAALREIARDVTYGWGMIPVSVRIGDTSFQTSLWPKDGGYVLPIKDAVRRSEAIDDGDVVTVTLAIRA